MAKEVELKDKEEKTCFFFVCHSYTNRLQFCNMQNVEDKVLTVCAREECFAAEHLRHDAADRPHVHYTEYTCYILTVQAFVVNRQTNFELDPDPGSNPEPDFF